MVIQRKCHWPSTTSVVLLLLWFSACYISGLNALHQHQTRTLSRRDLLLKSPRSLLPYLLAGSSTLGSSKCASAAATPSKAGTTPYLTKEYYEPNLQTAPSAGRTYFPTLTPPFLNRATYKYDLGRNQWALEQLLSFANVTATIRTTIVQLEATGGLWVHSPQWPTGEYLKLLKDIGRPVEHIVLPCNAFEHGAPMKEFCKRFPDAQVWISPGQYGPFGSCGRSSTTEKVQMGYRVDGILGGDDPLPPWADEFDMTTLYVSLPENAGPVSEVAFCHRPTKTLIATDAVVFVPEEGPPPIFGTYFDSQTMNSSPNFWEKSVLQAVFLPLRQDSRTGAYPGFEALKNRLVRAPILRAFTDARAPKESREWIGKVASWDFDRVVTSHFASPIAATPSNVQDAFAYLQDGDGEPSLAGLRKEKLPPIACQDWQLLEGLNQAIAENKLGAVATFDYSKGCIASSE
mmetsp:Transcript_50299/g.75136  ORF Transcript_50299/g.75136 Transcript_50299/m.75136 type:complete len:460 (-) Transcript_50299:140-1519(-)